MVDSVAAPGSPEAEFSGTGAEDRATQILKWWKESRDHWADWREEAEEAYELVAGRQFSEEELSALKDQKRPPTVFNRIGPVIDAVCGSEAQNRQAVRYFPRELGDRGVNELLTNAAAWVRDRCNADIEENEALRDALICGIGVTETRLSYDENPDGEVEIERGDPLEIYVDPAAKKRNFVDARYIIRERWVSGADVEAQWPDFKDELAQAHRNPGDEGARPHNAQTPAYVDDGASHYRPASNEYRLLECQWRQYETFFRVPDPQNPAAMLQVKEDRFLQIKRMAEMVGFPLRAVRSKKWCWKRSICCGLVELAYTDAPAYNTSSIKFITGMRDRNNRVFYGLVRAMKDPQKWANKWLSQILHIVNSNAKGGVLYESGAFANPAAAKKEWAKPDGMIQLEPGGLQKIQQKQAITYPAGLDNLMQFAVSSIRDVTGVNLEMLGLADRQQAGVLEAQRKQAALSILATWFDALRAYRREQGKALFEFINRYISDGRLVRIDSENGKKYLPLVRQPDTIEYDCVIDSAPTSVNVKQQTFEVLQMVLPQMAKMGMPIPPEAIEYLPIPESLASKWKEMLQSGGALPPEVQQQIAEGQQQIQQLTQANQALEQKVAQMQADRSVDIEKLRVDAFEAVTDRGKVKLQLAEVGMGMGDEDAVMPAVNGQIAAVLNTLTNRMTEQLKQELIAAMNAPKRIEYGPDGQVATMNGRRVVRDGEGRLVGLQ